MDMITNGFVGMLCLTILMIFSNVSFASATTLSIPQYQSDFACWSAAASIIANYLVNNNSSTTWCWAYEQDIYRDKYPSPQATGQPGGVDDVVAGVELKTGISGNYSASALTYNGIKWQTDNNGPIEAGVTNMHGGAHGLAIRGYLASSPSPYIYYTDPYDGLYSRATYNYLVNTLGYCNSAWWK